MRHKDPAGIQRCRDELEVTAMDYEGVYRIRFKSQTPWEAVEDTLGVTAMAVESLLGRTALKLDATFRLNRADRSCVVDASTMAGRHIARIFVGLLARELGEDAFTVERTTAAVCAAGG